jgi:hypothetical protein
VTEGGTLKLMKDPAPRYWFRAKTYGLGWGLPLRWQGWAVLVSFVVLLVLGGALFPPATKAVLYALYVAGLSAAVVGIAYLKGEPTKWRWGGR